jgi:Polysaccharide lyase
MVGCAGVPAVHAGAALASSAPADKAPVTIAAGPSGVVASASATFTVTKAYSVSSLHCQLDGAAVTACVSPVSYSGLSNSSHTFSVYATGGSGGRIVGQTQTRSWTVSVPAPAPAANPGLAWNGDLSTGNTSQYWGVQGCAAGGVAPQGVTVVNSPTRPGYAYSSAFTVSDQSVTANCPNLGSAGHPNANIESPGLFSPGDNDYIGFSTMFPSSFPSNVCTPWVANCWMQVMEIYAQPYAGVTPVGLYVVGNQLVLEDAGTPIWTSATNIVKGAWEDTVLHVNFSTDPTVGYVELSYNGVLQTLTGGQTRHYEATLQTGNNWDGTDPDRLYLSQYRGPNPAMGTVTLYHSAAKVAHTLAQATP